LNNIKGKIELRYPDGKVASRAKYNNGKISIEEGMVYEKVKGGWVWRSAKQDTKTNKQKPSNIQYSINNNQSDNAIDDQEIVNDGEQFPIENKKEKIKILLPENFGINENPIGDNLNEKVLGVSIEKNWQVYDLGDRYVFVSVQDKKRDHYTLAFFKNIFSFINERINSFLN
jgi:hypothetical protein